MNAVIKAAFKVEDGGVKGLMEGCFVRSPRGIVLSGNQRFNVWMWVRKITEAPRSAFPKKKSHPPRYLILLFSLSVSESDTSKAYV